MEVLNWVILIKTWRLRTSLVVQRLRLPSSAGAGIQYASRLKKPRHKTNDIVNKLKTLKMGRKTPGGERNSQVSLLEQGSPTSGI